MKNSSGRTPAGRTLAAAAAGVMLSAVVMVTGATAATADSPWDRVGPHGPTSTVTHDSTVGYDSTVGQDRTVGQDSTMAKGGGQDDSPWD